MVDFLCRERKLVIEVEADNMPRIYKIALATSTCAATDSVYFDSGIRTCWQTGKAF